MSVECREIVDSIKEPAKCQDCDDLQKEFAKNPGGKPMNRKGLVIAAITGLFSTLKLDFNVQINVSLRWLCLSIECHLLTIRHTSTTKSVFTLCASNHKTVGECQDSANFVRTPKRFSNCGYWIWRRKNSSFSSSTWLFSTRH